MINSVAETSDGGYIVGGKFDIVVSEENNLKQSHILLIKYNRNRRN